MFTSTIVTIADAAVLALNSHSLSQSFMAQRCYVPSFDLKEMKNLHVTVVPRGVEMANISRLTVQNAVQVDVAIQQKLPAPADPTGN